MDTSKISLARVLALLVFLLGIQSAWADVWDGVTKTPAKTEKINGKDYFLIESAANLAWFSDTVNRSTAANVKLNAKVVANFIDMNHKPFVPIAAGKGDKYYGGIFDGNHVVIRNLSVSSEHISAIDKKYGQNIAFIAALDGGIVKNVVLDSVYIKATTDIGSILAGEENKISVGTIVAWQKSGTVEGCYASGIIYNSGKGQAVGGIVGNADSGIIRNNLSIISIQISGSQAYVGGIIGQAKNNIKIESCVYDGGKFINDSSAHDGGVIGLRYEDNVDLVKNSYYDENDVDQGVASGSSDGVFSASILNEEQIACILNEGEWDETTSTCSADGVWSTGDHITNQGVSKNDKNETIFTIKFDANGGTFPEGAKTVKYLRFGELVTTAEITSPTYAGDSIFWGWSMDPAATAPVTSMFLDTAYGQRTVYAVWKKTVDVAFDYNNDVNPGVETKKIGLGDSVVAVTTLTTYTDVSNSEYHLIGWSKDKTATEPLKQLGVAEEGLTYYAVWSTDPVYTVSFDMQGKGSDQHSQQIKENGKAVKFEPVADGYSFGGWYTEAACQNAFDFETAIAKDMTLYAKWNLETYTITYEMDGGENDESNPTNYTIEDETIVFKNPKERVGYLFDGWYYNPDYSHVATQISQGHFGSFTLYAKWIPTQYEVIYSAGSRGMGSVEIDYKPHGDSLVLSSEKYLYYNENYRVSFLHAGWTLSDGGSKEYDFGAKYGTDANVILYPYWSKLVKVHYGSNDKDTLWVDLSAVESDSLVSNAISEALLSNEPVIELPSKNADDKYVYTLKWVSDSLAVYEPIFEKSERKKEIVVAYGSGERDTIIIKDPKFKTDEELQKLIKDAFANHDPVIPLPTKAADSLYEYEFAKFVLNTQTGIYEPLFVKAGNLLFKINFHLPEGAELVENFAGYKYGEVTKLPDAVMTSDTSWKFNGWYTKTKGRGDRVKAMREKDSGNKSLYPLFQKTLRYDANGDKGEIKVIYTDRADTTIARALRSVTPKGYTEGKVTYTFSKWVLEDGVYTATFKNQTVRFNVVLDSRSFNIEEAQVGDRITVFDMDGRVVKRGIVSNGSQHVEVPKSGSYTVRVGKDAVQVNVK
ncbi:InlB B-repeat-containing protein [Fibrobacter sp. UWB10]|uniref:InlB B-repeat-containing protein n=1 Tax=Fibrobacter sp. UWB10 TaxID=1896201 RepID=UPI002403086A|nr:InlB B-repeat-containing protein [Fibrobacter sp. UWB10]SMP40927.1 Listeria/Bacterioides repeat-containing protein [Fibrobacter sp. UWB10]